MTDPSQYFRGRTVQEQMNEVIGYVDVRSAEVATDAIASDVAQVHQDMLDADADATAAAASAAAAAGTLANAVKKTGEASQSIAGDIAVAGDLDVGGDADITGALDVTGAITGNDASLIGTVEVPTEATGTFSLKSANSTKVKNELDAYIPVIRTTGNQTKTGILTFKSDAIVNLYLQSDTATINTDSGLFPRIGWYDKNGVELAKLLVVTRADGTTALAATTRNSDGTQTTTVLSQGVVI